MTRIGKASILVGAAVLIAGVSLWRSARKKTCNNRLDQVANEGYETAHDILFPKSRKGKNVRLGPIHYN